MADGTLRAMNPDLGQWMTPDWLAGELVDRYFSDLSMFDTVIEPSCGTGAFLRAIPEQVRALGVEIDADLARRAARSTGREVVIGDFSAIELPQCTAVIGNPPFRMATIQAFLRRAFELLPEDGRVGFILPAYTFQTTRTTLRMAERWHIAQDAIPREFFPRISVPVCFARFTKGRRGLVGFSLYHEAGAVLRLQRRYRALLAQGETSAWAAVTRAALEQLGGVATLSQLYAEVAGSQPTGNKFWQAKVRQQVQRIATRVGPATWALAGVQDSAMRAAA